MSRDLLGRPPLRVSELPPGLVMLYAGEPRAVACPGCGRWMVPRDGGLRRHAADPAGGDVCAQSGRRVWFDLSPAQWQENLAAARNAARRPVSLDRAVRQALAAAPAMRAAGLARQAASRST